MRFAAGSLHDGVYLSDDSSYRTVYCTAVRKLNYLLEALENIQNTQYT